MQQDVVLREHEAPVRKIVAGIIGQAQPILSERQSCGSREFKVREGGRRRLRRECAVGVAQHEALHVVLALRAVWPALGAGDRSMHKEECSVWQFNEVGFLARPDLAGDEEDGLAPAQRAGAVGSKESADGHVVQHVSRFSALPQPQHCDEPPVAERLDPGHHALHAQTQVQSAAAGRAASDGQAGLTMSTSCWEAR